MAAYLGMTCRAYLASVGADEVAEYVALLNVEPFGPWRDDLRAALQSYWANVPHGGRDCDLDAYLLRTEPRDCEPESVSDQLAVARALARKRGTNG